MDITDGCVLAHSGAGGVLSCMDIYEMDLALGTKILK